jgi:hypothetical protein
MAARKPLNILSDIASGMVAAQSEQLTGIPFYQNAVAQREKRAQQQETVTANGARLQSALNAKIVSQSDVDKFPGGSAALAKHPDFDKAFSEMMGATEVATNKANDVDAAKIDAIRAGVVGTFEGLTPFQINTMTADKISKDHQKEEQGLAVQRQVKAATDLIVELQKKTNPTQEDLLTLATHLKSTEARLLSYSGADTTLVKSHIATLQASGAEAAAAISRNIRSSEVSVGVQGGSLELASQMPEEEYNSTLRTNPALAGAVSKGDANLTTLRGLPLSDAQLASMANEAIADGDRQTAAALSLYAQLKEGGDWDMRSLMRNDRQLAEDMMGFDPTAIIQSSKKSTFLLGTLQPAQDQLQQDLDALSPEFKTLAFKTGIPDATVEVGYTESGGTYALKPTRDLFQDFRNNLVRGDFTHQELQSMHTEILQGAAIGSKLVEAIQEPIERQLIANITSGGVDPADASAMEQEGAPVIASSSLDKSVGDAVAQADRLAEEQYQASLLTAGGALAQNVADTVASNVIGRQAIQQSGFKQGPLTQNLKRSQRRVSGTPAYVALTRIDSTDAANLQARSESLANKIKTNETPASSNPVEAAKAYKEKTFVDAQLRARRVRNAFGNSVDATIDALATNGYDGLIVFASAVDGITPPLEKEALEAEIKQIKNLKTSNARLDAAKQFIARHADTLLADNIDAKAFKLTKGDFLGMIEEQFDMFEESPGFRTGVNLLRGRDVSFSKEGGQAENYYGTIGPKDWSRDELDYFKVMQVNRTQ